MNTNEVVNGLKALGSEQTRKTYTRHGIEGPMFGVKFGDLNKFVKKIGVDQNLAEQLWDVNNHDVRVAAAKIADPELIKSATLDKWANATGNHVLSDELVNIASKRRDAKQRFEKWRKSKKEWVASAGWRLLAILARPEFEVFTDEEFSSLLDFIESNIHKSPNWVRYCMNTALISIGIRSEQLHNKATATAKQIGSVEVDHGDTACKTPDAIPYMKKALDHQKKMKQKATKKKVAK